MNSPFNYLLLEPTLGYIGPGAGFALAGSFLAIFGAVVSAISMVLFWPIRRAARMLFRRKPPKPPRFKRVVVLGLDGLDYGLTSRLLDEGRLPNLARLRDTGNFHSLASTLPPISPVAWSSFQTGVNPGKHNIFDFLTPDEKTYRPKLSSVEIRSATKTLGIGRLKLFSFHRPDVRMLRKSKPFWSVLSDYGIFNCVIRVPITFPPEKLRGVTLSAMCVPDLRGTQGTFSQFTTRAKDDSVKTGGEVQYVARCGDRVECELIGPPSSKPGKGDLRLPFSVRIRGSDTATLTINGTKHTLKRGQYTDWITVKFRLGFGSSVQGVCRFMLLATDPEFDLYATPIHIDPEKPAMAIGYPKVYPIYLAKRQGPYATLGLAEDTWGLSEEVLEDQHFFEQCRDIDLEREAMFFDGLEKVPEGFCVCVFDGTDRMQHMFWRYLDDSHPARPPQVPAAFATAIEDLYARMDALVGRTMAKCDRDDTLLMVLSDHGFNTFRRGIDLNRWLEENGYLFVNNQQRNKDYLAGVDWSRTKAFAIGLTGVFINLEGKFEQGIINPQEAEAVREEIAAKLRELVDPQTGTKAIKAVYQAAKAYRGPYKENAPDLIVGYAGGYRVSWDAAVGRTSTEVFSDNKKAWSGDHCVDPTVVPGVLFANHAIETTNPRLLDIAPTILDLFGCPVPDHMDGRVLEVGKRKTVSTVLKTVPPETRKAEVA